MQFFSDEYLMHYGVKGMKWRKHKRNLTRNENGEIITDFQMTPAEKEGVQTYSGHPEAYLDDAYTLVNGHSMSLWPTQSLLMDPTTNDGRWAEHERHNIRQTWTDYRREQEKTPEGKKRVAVIRAAADELRRMDAGSYDKKQREKAYHRNEKRLAKQQKKAKVKNSVKRARNSAVNKVKKTKARVQNALNKLRRKKKS